MSKQYRQPDLGTLEEEASRSSGYQDDGSESPGQQHSTTSLGNWNDGLFEEMDMIPSISRGTSSAECCITVDDVVGASTAYQPFLTDSEKLVTQGRKSLTPQKSGVTGSALRLMSCEKGPNDEEMSEDGEEVQQVQLDSAPRTRYTGILKKLEFSANSGINDKYVSTLRKADATPVGQTIPETLSGRTTTSKRLMFSSLAHKGPSGRRVTFGGVSVETPSTLYEEDDMSSGGHMSLSSLNAGSTPYSGRSTSRCQDSDDESTAITRDQLASALKKSLNFIDKKGVSSFSFADPHVNEDGCLHPEEKTTPDFSFQPSGGKSRRLTPQSCSPSLLALHGRAKRIATPQCEASDEENIPVGLTTSPSPPHEQPMQEEVTMPRRSPRLMSKEGLKLSPTEQGIRDSLKRASRRRSSPQSDVLKNSNL